jgi:spoIIIJ-associated protein
MKAVEVEGSSVDEAIQSALTQMGVKREQVETEILDAGTRGFLGFIGNRLARVRITLKATPEQLINDFVASLVDSMGMDLSYKTHFEDEYWFVDFDGPDVRILIGRRGETLNALQMTLNMAINKQLEEKVRIIVDAEGYRKRREETLQRLARRLLERVRRSKKDVSLEPMTPQERRIIHLELQNNQWVYTVSEGEEPNRKVIICLKR